MKTSSLVTSLILAASATGAVLVKLGGAQITAVLNGEVVIATAASIAVLLFAAYDYSRRIESLRVITPLLRNSVPSDKAPRPQAYGIARVCRSAIVERAA